MPTGCNILRHITLTTHKIISKSELLFQKLKKKTLIQMSMVNSALLESSVEYCRQYELLGKIQTLGLWAIWVRPKTTWPASCEICRQVRKQVRTGHGTTNWFQIGKGVRQGCILSPCLFNLYAVYIMRNSGLEEAQAGIKIAGSNMNNLRYADDTTFMAESEEEL